MVGWWVGWVGWRMGEWVVGRRGGGGGGGRGGEYVGVLNNSNVN